MKTIVLDAHAPQTLAALHRAHAVDDRVSVRVRRLDDMAPPWSDVVVGAGFTLSDPARADTTDDARALTRCWSLPDTVGPGLRLLVCGLNPSPAASDAGVGFARPGNRFWPAAMDAGLLHADRDPDAALRDRGVGMTDLVKRTTPRRVELTRDEYRQGLARLERLAEWLGPAMLLFVGLAGWRAVVDRTATAGIQPRTIGGVPVYLMPSTSGLNASSTRGDLAEHVRAAGEISGIFG